MTIIGKVNGIISQCIGRGEHPGELEPVALAGFVKRRMARSGHAVEIEHLGVSQ